MNERIRQDLMDARMASAFDDWLEWLFTAESAVCDHVWNVESYAGPNNGYDDFQCKRCGYQHTVTYY